MKDDSSMIMNTNQIYFKDKPGQPVIYTLQKFQRGVKSSRLSHQIRGQVIYGAALSVLLVRAKSWYIWQLFQLVERLPRTQRKESGILHRVSGSFKGQEDKKIFISSSASGLNNWLIIGSTWCMLCLIQPWTRSLSIDFCVDFFVAGGGGAFFRMSYLHEFTDGIN